MLKGEKKEWIKMAGHVTNLSDGRSLVVEMVEG